MLRMLERDAAGIGGVERRGDRGRSCGRGCTDERSRRGGAREEARSGSGSSPSLPERDLAGLLSQSSLDIVRELLEQIGENLFLSFSEQELEHFEVGDVAELGNQSLPSRVESVLPLAFSKRVPALCSLRLVNAMKLGEHTLKVLLRKFRGHSLDQLSASGDTKLFYPFLVHFPFLSSLPGSSSHIQPVD